MPVKTPSLRQLARDLGISHTTVMEALKGNPRVAAATRARVKAAAGKQGYFLNDLPRGMMTGKTGTIGIVVPRLDTHFLGHCVHYAVDALWRRGFATIVQVSDLDIGRERQVLERLAGQRVEGVLLMPSREDEEEVQLMEVIGRSIPVVLVNNPLPLVGLPLVRPDDSLAGELVARHLLGLGHRRVAHLAGALDSAYADRTREFAFVETMRAGGGNVTVAHLRNRFRYREDTRAVLPDLLSPTRNISALYCCHDLCALAALEWCQQQGLDVPGDLSLVGNGNIARFMDQELLTLISPSLTTVDLHPERLGVLAAETLLDVIEGKTVSRSTMVKPEWIERASTRSLERY